MKSYCRQDYIFNNFFLIFFNEVLWSLLYCWARMHAYTELCCKKCKKKNEKKKNWMFIKCMNASKECIKMIGHITLYLLIYFKMMFGKNFDDIIFPHRYPKTRMRWWRESSTGYWRPPPTSPTRWISTLSTISPPPWGRLWRRSSR